MKHKTLSTESQKKLLTYNFPGNVRELKNLAEQISVLSTSNIISSEDLRSFLPDKITSRLPILASQSGNSSTEFNNEREILYKLFFDMKKDVTELKKMFLEILQNPALTGSMTSYSKENILKDFPILQSDESSSTHNHQPQFIPSYHQNQPVIINENDITHEDIEESLNINEKEKELIIKALMKHKGKRKDASSDLGISERTLYRKLKEYSIDDL